jgi:hypothetical protein
LVVDIRQIRPFVLTEDASGAMRKDTILHLTKMAPITETRCALLWMGAISCSLSG